MSASAMQGGHNNGKGTKNKNRYRSKAVTVQRTLKGRRARFTCFVVKAKFHYAS